MIKNNKKRNLVDSLQISLRFSKEYFNKLCEIRPRLINMQNDLTGDHPELESFAIYHRALWIALIIEVGKIFDNFYEENKKVISFKTIFKNSNFKDEINSIHGEQIITKIIHTRKTFTAHMGEKQEDVVSSEEICNSNLGELLNRLDNPLHAFTQWFLENRGWEKL